MYKKKKKRHLKWFLNSLLERCRQLKKRISTVIQHYSSPHRFYWQCKYNLVITCRRVILTLRHQQGRIYFRWTNRKNLKDSNKPRDAEAQLQASSSFYQLHNISPCFCSVTWEYMLGGYWEKNVIKDIKYVEFIQRRCKYSCNDFRIVQLYKH